MSRSFFIPDIAEYPAHAALSLHGPLNLQAQKVHRSRYSLREKVTLDVDGKPTNIPSKVNADPTSADGSWKDQEGQQWFSYEYHRDSSWRVAWAVANAEYEHKREEYALRFFDALYNVEWLPNSPTLWAAGTEGGQLSACFVVGPEGLHPEDPDSLDAILKVKNACEKITHSGGGIGIHLGALRPKGSPIRRGAHGTAYGPIEVLRQVSDSCGGLTQRGKREAAGMCIMPVSHPDIIDFIRCKTQEGIIHNFNISVGATNEFMEAVIDDEMFRLTHPKWVASVQHFPEDARPHLKLVPEDPTSAYISARWLFDQLVQGAWKNGEPGLFFTDLANQEAWAEYGIQLRGTNPCGEQPLPDWGVCNLGHINLARCIGSDAAGKPVVDWDKVRSLVWLGTRFLDNVIEVNEYPTPEIAAFAKKYRNIGGGLLGYADLLCEIGVKYGSKEALKLAGDIEAFRLVEARRCSKRLEQERGSNFGGDRRNLILLTIAPTGSTGQLAMVEGSGCEPIYGPGYWRKDHVHQNGVFVPTKYASNPAFKCAVSTWPLGDGKTESRPEFEVTTEEHIKTQAAFQKYNDSGISKTINMPNHSTQEDVWKAYILSWQAGCKGITVYRDGSRQVEVLSATKVDGKFDPKAALKGNTTEHTVTVSFGPEMDAAIAESVAKTGSASIQIMNSLGDVCEPIYQLEELADDAISRRFRVKYKGKRVYLFVGENLHGEPRELFVKTPGIFDNELPALDALCRMTSLALRAQVPLDKVIEQLEDSRGTLNQDNYPQVLLAGLQAYVSAEEAPDTEYIIEGAVPEVVSSNGCPLCKAPLKNESGCHSCSANCGYSKCG